MKTKIGIIVLIMFLVLACAKTNEPDENKIDNEYIKLSEAQEIEGLRISDLEINVVDKTMIRGKVQNITEKAIQLNLIEIELYDENKNYLIKTSGSIGEKIDTKEIKEFSIVIEYDLSKAVYVKYKIIK